MAIPVTSVVPAPNAAGVASTASVTVAANTKLMLFFIALDNSNSAANNTPPSVVSWNGVTATLVTNIVTDTGAPFGQCQYLYKIENPTPGTGTATVNHATQYHHQIILNLVSTNVLTPTYSVNTVRGTGTAPSISMTSAVGDLTLFSIAADALDPTGVVANNGSTQVNVTGGASRQTYRVSSSISAGATNSENWTLASSQRYSALAVNIVEGLVIVDSINGSGSNPTIDVAGSNTASTTGLGTITSLSVSDGTRAISATPSMPSGDGTFAFTWPYADGVVAPLFGAVTATFNDGSRSAAMAGTMLLPATHASVTFSGATDISEHHLGHVLTLTDGKRLYYPTTNGAVVNADGSMAFNTLPHTLNAMLHDVTTGLITRVGIEITASGVIGEVSIGNFIGVTIAGKILTGSILKGKIL